MKIDAALLRGRSLDWCVAQVCGYVPAKWETRAWGRQAVPAPTRSFSTVLVHATGGYSRQWNRYAPSEDGVQGLPILDLFEVSTWVTESGGDWQACLGNPWAQPAPVTALGPTRLIAGLRALVLSRLGATVEVPEELVS